jgi:hypothetical protein
VIHLGRARTLGEILCVLVDSIDEVFDAAFDGKAPTRSKPVPVREKQVAHPA